MREARAKAEHVPEAALQAAWAALAGANAALTTAEGETLRVVFPGVPNRGAGPDFQGAIIATERGRLVRGDVEIHRQPSGWREHGHAGDPRYAGVVLHVVGDRAAGPTPLPGGGRAPVLQFPLPADPDAPAAAIAHPCTACAGLLPAPATLERLTALGLARVRRKAAGWLRLLRRAPAADQALYAALLETLGYPGNRRPLRALAAAAPWDALRGAGGLAERQGLLLGAGGWLGVPNGLPADFSATRLEAWQAQGAPAAVSRSGWALGACRPAAHPARRLAGAAVWPEHWPIGPVAWLVEAAAGEPRTLSRRLATGLAVEAGEAALGGTAPLGGARAAVAVVNVALPFLLAWAEMAGDRCLAEQVEAGYRAQPPLEADGVVRPLLAALGLSGQRLTACQQQGLHHLFRRWCLRGRQGRCTVCE